MDIHTFREGEGLRPGFPSQHPALLLLPGVYTVGSQLPAIQLPHPGTVIDGPLHAKSAGRHQAPLFLLGTAWAIAHE